jgi:anti-sigma B factor antagonist
MNNFVSASDFGRSAAIMRARMSPARILNISVRVLDAAHTVVDLEGTIDLQNSPALRTALFDKLAATSRLALNMSGVRYIDSSGIATLIEVFKKARGLKKDFVLFGLGPSVYSVLKLTNLLGVFRVFDTEEHALDG